MSASPSIQEAYLNTCLHYTSMDRLWIKKCWKPLPRQAAWQWRKLGHTSPICMSTHFWSNLENIEFLFLAANKHLNSPSVCFPFPGHCKRKRLRPVLRELPKRHDNPSALVTSHLTSWLSRLLLLQRATPIEPKHCWGKSSLLEENSCKTSVRLTRHHRGQMHWDQCGWNVLTP